MDTNTHAYTQTHGIHSCKHTHTHTHTINSNRTITDTGTGFEKNHRPIKKQSLL